jgi:hypothetical protein
LTIQYIYPEILTVALVPSFNLWHYEQLDVKSIFLPRQTNNNEYSDICGFKENPRAKASKVELPTRYKRKVGQASLQDPVPTRVKNVLQGTPPRIWHNKKRRVDVQLKRSIAEPRNHSFDK